MPGMLGKHRVTKLRKNMLRLAGSSSRQWAKPAVDKTDESRDMKHDMSAERVHAEHEQDICASAYLSVSLIVDLEHLSPMT